MRFSLETSEPIRVLLRQLARFGDRLHRAAALRALRGLAAICAAAEEAQRRLAKPTVI